MLLKPNLGRGNCPLHHPRWFSLNNSEIVKAAPLPLCSIYNFLSETFEPNLASLNRPSLQIFGKTQTGILISGFLVNLL